MKKKWWLWVKRHLNWTYVIVFAGSYVIGGLIAVVLVLFTSLSDAQIDSITRLLMVIVMFFTSLWILEQKKRSLRWVFLGWVAAPLWLPSKAIKTNESKDAVITPPPLVKRSCEEK